MEAVNKKGFLEFGVFVQTYIGLVAVLKLSFVAHTSVNVLLEKEGKYAGIYS